MGWGLDDRARKRFFVMDYLTGEYSMTELCAQYGVSRQSGHALWKRFQEEGYGCVEPRSHAPHHPGRVTDEALVARIVAAREAHPSWGARKLKAWLEAREPDVVWPAASTVGDVLKRTGLIVSRRRRQRPLPRTKPFLPVGRANDLWCLDFKGWFRTQDGRRCDPFTVTDAHSRMLLGCRICEPTAAGVEAAMDQVLRCYGLPDRLRMDNGAPWGSRGAGGLTRLSVKWLKLGLDLEFIEPGCPQDNGRHERMHATLKTETLRPPAATPAAQQARFDAFRRSFNEERPHEALGQTPPAQSYQPAARRYPSRIAHPHYAPGTPVRQVRSNGEIKWRGEMVFVGEAFIGEPVQLVENETGDAIVRFMHVELGLIPYKSDKMRRFGPPRPGRAKANTAHKTTRDTVNHHSGL